MKPLTQATLLVSLLAGSLSAAELFPLRTGNTWTYREKNTGQTFAVKVGLPYLISDRVYYTLTGYVEQRQLVRLNEQNQLVAIDEETGRESVLTSFAPSAPGTWWDAPLRGCEQQGQTQERRATHDGPIGPVNDALEIRFRMFSCADTGVELEQYAENIGMLRRVSTSIAGPRQYDLVYAQVGHTVIDAAQRSGFSLNVEETPRENSWTATFRLQNNTLTPLKLNFASGQEFDFLLKDPTGRTLWRWSSYQLFIAAAHERTVQGEWSGAVTVPRVVPFAPVPGTYTIEAWVTAEGNSPQFAASFPLPSPEPAGR